MSSNGDQGTTTAGGPVTVELATKAIRFVLDAKGRHDVAVTERSTLEDLGLSSLDAGEVFVLIEELCGVELEPLSVDELRTVGDLVLLQPAGPGLPPSVSDEIHSEL